MVMGTLSIIGQDNAHNTCVANGYETYITYDRFMLSTKPKALICGTVAQQQSQEGHIQAYSVDGEDVINLNNMGK